MEPERTCILAGNGGQEKKPENIMYLSWKCCTGNGARRNIMYVEQKKDIMNWKE